MGCEIIDEVDWSLHQKRPGVLQSSVIVDELDVVDVGLGSLQPNHPGVLQVLVDELVFFAVVVAVGVCELLLLVVVVSSLHPNQPGVLQV